MNETPYHKQADQKHNEKKGQKKKPKKKQERTGPRPPKKITQRYLYNSGLAYLQRFPASTHHFRRTMGNKITRSCTHHIDQDKEKCLELLEGVIEQFIELELLNDEAYLRGMVTSLRRRGLSQSSIIAKLGQKGLAREEITQAITEFDQREYEYHEEEYSGELHAAIKLARKKRLGPYDIEQKKDYQKSLATLARAGFSYDIASKALNLEVDDI